LDFSSFIMTCHRPGPGAGLSILVPLSLSVLAAAGCSSIASDEVAPGSQAEGGQITAGDRGETGADEPDPEDADGATGGDDGAETDDEPGAGPPSAESCPSPLPEGWIFCEDFETLQDPTEVFFEYQDSDGRFVLVDDEGASGTRSLRATYEEGKQSAGWLNIAFGRNPIANRSRPHLEPDADFEEIYWRLRVKMQSGWPDIGPHKLTRLTAFADDDWSQAVIANLWSNGSDVILMGDPATCVLDGIVNCSGFNDYGGLSFLEPLIGETPLFSKALSGEWHCVEGHVVLNTPGAADGVFEFWIDDHLENAAYDMDWRGTWSEYGLNLVSVENYWDDGAPATLHRWIDDIVVSTAPIGCD
jgi:hypothetical protein